MGTPTAEPRHIEIYNLEKPCIAISYQGTQFRIMVRDCFCTGNLTAQKIHLGLDLRQKP